MPKRAPRVNPAKVHDLRQSRKHPDAAGIDLAATEAVVALPPERAAEVRTFSLYTNEEPAPEAKLGAVAHAHKNSFSFELQKEGLRFYGVDLCAIPGFSTSSLALLVPALPAVAKRRSPRSG